MNSCIKNIIIQGAVVATTVFGVTACTPKVILDQPGSTIQVEHNPAGSTAVRITPREELNPAHPTPATPPVVVTTLKPDADDARREVADLQAQRDTVKGELARAVKERDQAGHDRVVAVAGAAQAQRTAASLTEEINRLSAQKAALEKEWVVLTSSCDKARTGLAEGQRAAEALNAEIKRLDGLKATAEQELTTVTTALASAKTTLADTNNAIAGDTNRVAELKKQHADSADALAAAQTKMESVTAETTKAAATLDGLRSQIEAKRRELAALMDKPANTGGNATTQPSSAAQAGTPTAPPTGGGHVAPLTAPIIGGIVALLAAAGAAMYFTRKPPVYAFTLLDESTKVPHRLQMTVGERVDLNGSPTKKAGAASGHAPYLTIDRKGRLALHPITGFATKLEGRPLGPTDAPTVKPGNVVEITANGQVSRLVVGPVAAVDRAHKTAMKMPTASVRPA